MVCLPLERRRAARSCAATPRCPCRPSARRAAAGAAAWRAPSRPRAGAARRGRGWPPGRCLRLPSPTSSSTRARGLEQRRRRRAPARQKRKLWPACACTASATLSQRAELGVDAGDLERAREALARAPRRGQRGDVLAGEADRAGVGAQVAGELADEGGLAGAVRADDGVRLAFAHVEVDAVGRAQRAEGLAQVRGPRAGYSWLVRRCRRGRAGRRSPTSTSSGPRITCQCSRSSAGSSRRPREQQREGAEHRPGGACAMPPRITMNMSSPERVPVHEVRA